MARGDLVGAAPTSISNGAYLTIQPAGGDVYTVMMIAVGGAAELYWSDGGNRILMDSKASAGAWLFEGIPIDNSMYLEVKNTESGARYMGWSGRQVA